MPLPAALAPALLKSAAAAGAALALWQAARRARWSEARPVTGEAALDGVEDGLALGWSRDAGRARGDLRGAWRGTLRLGEHGPGVAIDLSGLARLRLAALPARPGRSARR